MNEKIYYQFIPCNTEALACKSIMERSIRFSGLSKKSIAIDLGVGFNTLRHWLSRTCRVTIPAHLVRQFCLLTGDWALYRYMGKRRSA